MTDEWIDDEKLRIVDRSALELYTVCPQQAVWMDSGVILNETREMASGNAVHDALSLVTREFVDSLSTSDSGFGGYRAAELKETLDAYLLTSRPDIQQDAIDAMRASAWSWCKFLSVIHREEVLKFDGGEGSKSGQVSVDIPHLGLRLTSEIDFLHAGPAPEVIHEIDYKTGHKIWSSSNVAESFQFQFHAYLLLTEYPNVKAVEVRVWNTRSNRLTYGVVFDRTRDFSAIENRIMRAATELAKWSGKDPKGVDAWPAVDKCTNCRAACYCTASRHIGDQQSNPESLLEGIIHLRAKADAKEEILKGIVRQTGKDVILPNGDSFGLGKPKGKPRATYAVYSQKKDEEE